MLGLLGEPSDLMRLYSGKYPWSLVIMGKILRSQIF